MPLPIPEGVPSVPTRDCEGIEGTIKILVGGAPRLASSFPTLARYAAPARDHICWRKLMPERASERPTVRLRRSAEAEQNSGHTFLLSWQLSTAQDFPSSSCTSADRLAGWPSALCFGLSREKRTSPAHAHAIRTVRRQHYCCCSSRRARVGSGQDSRGACSPRTSCCCARL